MNNIKTTIGLEIHVQLKTKSKMFCRCDNEAFGAKPNTLVCPICLGMPGSLPVANEQAILWTIKTGLALNCEIPKIAKFDRKHYFYPDLPKGYQISQYDEPFATRGWLKIRNSKPFGLAQGGSETLRPRSGRVRNEEEVTIRINRVHLEEDAGKLIHLGEKSLVDLNRAGTPLMEIVTEPDITSPQEAGEFLRKLQKIVRDEVCVSEASMEKGHLRCDANISVTDGEKMSQIIEIKNLNSFRFVEKALSLVEEKLRSECPNWPDKLSKETWGYDSKNNKIFLQRRKEEAADYRYFPEPDLPPFDTSDFDFEALKAEISKGEDSKVEDLVAMGVSKENARVLIRDDKKYNVFEKLSDSVNGEYALLASAIINNYFGFEFTDEDFEKRIDYGKTIVAIKGSKLSKANFMNVVGEIHKENISFDEAFSKFSAEGEKIDLDNIICEVIKDYPSEVQSYKAGKKQLFGFFMGEAMRKTQGKADPATLSKIIREKLN